jgi:hypothetical protein
MPQGGMTTVGNFLVPPRFGRGMHVTLPAGSFQQRLGLLFSKRCQKGQLEMTGDPLRVGLRVFELPGIYLGLSVPVKQNPHIFLIF